MLFCIVDREIEYFVEDFDHWGVKCIVVSCVISVQWDNKIDYSKTIFGALYILVTNSNV